VTTGFEAWQLSVDDVSEVGGGHRLIGSYLGSYRGEGEDEGEDEDEGEGVDEGEGEGEGVDEGVDDVDVDVGGEKRETLTGFLMQEERGRGLRKGLFWLWR
jgi:hypothetical protein